MSSLSSLTKAELRKYVDTKFQAGASRFFKEEIQVLGVRSPQVKLVAAKFWPEVKKLPKDQIFTICEELWQNGFIEETFVAINWTNRLLKKLGKADFIRFTNWIDQYVNNWASCDIFCTHAVGYLVQKYPELFTELKTWTKSKNRWFKRAAAVSFVPAAAHGAHHRDVFAVATILLQDPDDLVRKGYGWALKSASTFNQKSIFDFVMQHKNKMPRTALRYAIEKMPADLKRLAMG